MTISREDGDKIIKNSTLPYASSHGNPVEYYKYICMYSEDELPIETTYEFDVATKIGNKFGLKIVNQDYGEGEGMHPKYKIVYAAISRRLEYASTAEGRIRSAEKELNSELEKYWARTIPGRK